MSDFQSIADRVEIEALRAEYTDAAMMRDYDRVATLFTPDAALRMPDVPVDLHGHDEIRAWGERVPGFVEYFIQTTHPGYISLDGDTATGRAYLQELIRLRDGSSHQNFAIYHDRYARTPDGWRFAERVYEIRYVDTSPLQGSAPSAAVDFTRPAAEDRLARAAAALNANGFAAEILDDAEAARKRVAELIPDGASVFTGASETLRLSGIESDLSESGRYDAARPRVLAMDRATQADDIRRLIASPDFVVGSVAAVTETGSVVAASASGSQLPAYAGGAGRVIWIVGAQKVVPDLPAALRRLEEHSLPLESARAQQVYGVPSAINRVLISHADHHPGRVTVLLLREAIGF